MGGCMSHIYDTNEKHDVYMCGLCNKGLSDRYLECCYCNRYMHYACARFGNYHLEHCSICGKNGSLIKRVNLELDPERRNTI